VKLPLILKKSQKFVESHSPAILTGVGVAGTVLTAYLAGKASFKASRLIHDYEEQDQKLSGGLASPAPMPLKQKVKYTWHLYVPSLAVGAVTITSICFARKIDGKRLAAAVTAAALSEKAFDEFKEKAAEMTSKSKVGKIHDAVMQDKVDKTDNHKLVIMAENDVLCLDAYSGRYFSSTMQKLRTAENDQAYEINHAFYVNLTNYYNLIGLEPNGVSDQLGWDSNDRFTCTYTSALKDDTPVIVVNFDTAPHNI